jgi:hypothetical protein
MGDKAELELRVNVNPGRVIFGINRKDIPVSRFTDIWPLVPIRDRTYTWNKPHKFCIHADYKTHRLATHDEIRCILPECSICTEAYLGGMTPENSESIRELLRARIVPFLGYQTPGKNAVEVYGLAVNPEYGIADIMNFLPLRSGDEQFTKHLTPFTKAYPLLQWDTTGRLQPNHVLMDIIMQTLLTGAETSAAIDRFACVWRLLKRFIIKEGAESAVAREFISYIRDYQDWPITDADYRLIVERRKAWKIR